MPEKFTYGRQRLLKLNTTSMRERKAYTLLWTIRLKVMMKQKPGPRGELTIIIL